MIKKYWPLFILVVALLVGQVENAFAQVTTVGGGTGTTSPSGILYGDGTLHLKTVGIGSNLTFSNGVLAATGGGGGSTFGTTSLSAVAPLQYSQSPLAQFSITQAGISTNGYLSSTDWNTFNNKQPSGTYVTTVSVASSNGFAGSSSGGATPALTLSTTITGLLKGNGTAISAATPGTDYDVFAWPFTSINGTSVATSSGLVITASSTIGNGTQATGLFISGGSTTTLNAYFAGKVGIGTSSPETALTIQSTATGDETPAFTIDGTGLSNGNGDMELEAGANTTAEANIDFARQGTVEWQQGIQNGGGATGNDFELWDGSNNPVFTINHSSLDVNIGTTTCGGESELCVWGDSGVSSSIFDVISSASSSLLSIAGNGFGTTTMSGLNVNGSATSTSNVGFNITAGCYGVRGTCIGSGSGTVTSVGLSDSNSTLTIGSTPITTNGTITATLNLAHNNTWSALQNFSNATSTLFSSTYASSTNAFFGSATLASLGIAAGQFAAFDPTGKLIGTTTPSGSNSAFSPSANYATATALPSNTYLAGVITAVANGALSVDGANPSVGQRVLVKNEGTAANNGLYDVTAAGSAIAAFVLTRDAQYNSSSNIIPGIITYVISGSTNDDDFWAMTSAAPITVGTTALNYIEVSGGGAGVASVSNSDSTITFSPTTGAVVGSLNINHSNIWTALQVFNASIGVGSSTPFSALSVGTGAASSSITVAEYKYGKSGNVATSTAQNIDCNASTQIAEPIGTSATTLTLINMTPGKKCIVVVQNPAAAAGAITWAVQSGAILKWAGGTVPTQTLTANAIDIWSFLATQGSSTMQINGAQSANF